MEARDTQREKLYRSERAVKTDLVGDGSVGDIAVFVQKVLKSAVVRRNYPHTCKTITVKDGRGRRKAGATASYITLPAGWARRYAVVLHELAHVINGGEAQRERSEKMREAERAANRLGTNYWHPNFAKRRKELETCEPRASHGWQFAAILLNLVRWFVGKDAERALKAVFRANGVRFVAKRRMSEAQRLAAAERLRAMRLRALPTAADDPPTGGA